MSHPKNPVFNKNGGTRKRLAAGACESASAVTLPNPWQLERAKTLHRICGCIDGRIARGQTLQQAITYFAWYWAHHFYRCEPSQPLRLSRKTIYRAWYHWKANGQTAAAFVLRYNNARIQIDAARRSRFVQSCLAPGTVSYQAAFARLKNPVATVSAFQKTLPASLRAAITQLFARERAVLAARLAAVKIARSATLSPTGIRSRNQRAFKAVLKPSAQNSKPATF